MSKKTTFIIKQHCYNGKVGPKSLFGNEISVGYSETARKLIVGLRRSFNDNNGNLIELFISNINEIEGSDCDEIFNLLEKLLISDLLDKGSEFNGPDFVSSFSIICESKEFIIPSNNVDGQSLLTSVGAMKLSGYSIGDIVFIIRSKTS